MEAVDLIVKTDSPYSILNNRMLSFGALAHEQPLATGVFRVRCLGKTSKDAQAQADFLTYVIGKQGYGEVLRSEHQKGA